MVARVLHCTTAQAAHAVLEVVGRTVLLCCCVAHLLVAEEHRGTLLLVVLCVEKVPVRPTQRQSPEKDPRNPTFVALQFESRVQFLDAMGKSTFTATSAPSAFDEVVAQFSRTEVAQPVPPGMAAFSKHWRWHCRARGGRVRWRVLHVAILVTLSSHRQSLLRRDVETGGCARAWSPQDLIRFPRDVCAERNH